MLTLKQKGPGAFPSGLMVAGALVALEGHAKFMSGVAGAKKAASTGAAVVGYPGANEGLLAGPTDQSGVFLRAVGAGQILSGVALLGAGLAMAAGLVAVPVVLSAAGIGILGAGLLGIGGMNFYLGRRLGSQWGE
jgi:hypothetical protein